MPISGVYSASGGPRAVLQPQMPHRRLQGPQTAAYGQRLPNVRRSDQAIEGAAEKRWEAGMSNSITTGQLKRLQVLYGQLARHSDAGSGRESRLEWASSLLTRPIASFSDLSLQEANQLIDTLQGQLGVHTPAKKRPMSRHAAEKAGTEGRRDQIHAETTIASAEDIARIDRGLELLGWSRAQFDEWLRSPRSPLGKRGSPTIRTLWDANRVWWALKGMAKHQGKWKGRMA